MSLCVFHIRYSFPLINSLCNPILGWTHFPFCTPLNHMVDNQALCQLLESSSYLCPCVPASADPYFCVLFWITCPFSPLLVSKVSLYFGSRQVYVCVWERVYVLLNQEKVLSSSLREQRVHRLEASLGGEIFPFFTYSLSMPW